MLLLVVKGVLPFWGIFCHFLCYGMLACLIKHLRMETNMKFHVHKAQRLNPKICNYFAVPNTVDLQHDLHLQQVFNCEVFTIFSQIQHINTKWCLVLGWWVLKASTASHSILLWCFRKTNLLSNLKHLVFLHHAFQHFGWYMSSDMIFTHSSHQLRDWNRN